MTKKQIIVKLKEIQQRLDARFQGEYEDEEWVTELECCITNTECIIEEILKDEVKCPKN